jgi:hypothetical protein
VFYDLMFYIFIAFCFYLIISIIFEMDGRKRLSGSQYKKLAKEKSKREEEVLSKVPKLGTFFKTKRCDLPSTSSGSAEELTPTPPIEELEKSEENNDSTISKGRSRSTITFDIEFQYFIVSSILDARRTTRLALFL